MRVDLLRGEIARAGKTQKEVALYIGMSECTFIRHMKKGVFGTDDSEKMIEFLKIKDPAPIFLTSL